ncbi:JmjC domain-containing protein [Amycolatopsis sp. NPDC051903]|uniref:JmjC domain-containing protein n=1 Tax=Amycolatopsis sp. NPDC051903 TaxID=3363936 RepID=UPI0037ADC418
MTTTIAYEPIMTDVLDALGPRERLSRACLTGRVDPERARAELGWSVVEELLATSTFDPGMFRIITEHGHTDPELYLASTLNGLSVVKRTMRANVLVHELSIGSTLNVNGADRLHSGLQADRELLEYAVGRLAWCNGFVSHTGSSAFGRHHDNHNVVVVQAEGSKHWRVFAPDQDAPVFDTVLTAGDVLHVPTGWDHEVTGLGGSSVHWTFGFCVPSDHDIVLAELAHRASRGEDLVVPDGDLADLTDLDTAARARSLDRRAGANLPWSLGDDLPELDELLVRWAARLPPAVTRSGDTLLVASLGSRYRIDARFDQAMRLLARGGRVRASVLGSEAEVRTFLAFALEQRLVLLERDS